MKKPTIIVTGANGQLGRELQVVSKANSAFDFVFLTKQDLPIDDQEKVKSLVESLQPAYVINCAAYTAVDKAEVETAQAFSINGSSVQVLAEACKAMQAKLIHISTDYVFNGNATKPYKEDDEVEPVNAYGASKLKGEELALTHSGYNVVIIRTSWVYSEFGNNFVKTMMRLMNERERLGVVNDQQGSPTYAFDLASLIVDKIIQQGKWLPGVYHYSNEGVISWYDFAKGIKEITGSRCEINAIATSDFPTPAKRPAYSGLDKTKIKSAFKTKIPDWRESLHRCIEKIKANQ